MKERKERKMQKKKKNTQREKNEKPKETIMQDRRDARENFTWIQL